MTGVPATIKPVSLAELVQAGLVQSVVGDATVMVRDVRHDSRCVEPGDLFVAIEGASYDGASFAENAVARGASAVVSSQPLELPVPVALDENPQRALGRIAAHIHNHPSRQLPVVGVTGTNGKTTVAYLLESMLLHVGALPAVTGTVSFRGPQGVVAATHTTPMADDVQRLVRASATAGATHFVMEVSSHALDQGRIDDVQIEVAAFTNITQDHLDYHGSFERYRAAKARLFTELKPRHVVLNVDDALGAELADPLGNQPASTQGMQVWRCSTQGAATAQLRVQEWSSSRAGLRACLWVEGEAYDLSSPLVGAHNLDNLLIALGCGRALGYDAKRLLAGLAQAHGAPGRFERVHDPRGTLVLVDYAHTPDALGRALDALRPLTSGRLWVVFGAGGDRDRSKRPLMGEAAAARADVIVLTSDNPRRESPQAIVDEIVPGLAGAACTIELDRAKAIADALQAAGPDDTVLIAGKGHEDYQVIGTQRFPFDDRAQARQALAALQAGSR